MYNTPDQANLKAMSLYDFKTVIGKEYRGIKDDGRIWWCVESEEMGERGVTVKVKIKKDELVG